jgi:hypothetical protein
MMKLFTVSLLAMGSMAEDAAAVDCQGQWVNSGDCNLGKENCGCGVQYQTFNILTESANGGKACEKADGAKRGTPCEGKPCPEWTPWSEWSCDAACGEGTETRSRNDKYVTDKIETESRPCENLQPCPVDCVMSEWSEFGACSKSCGTGEQSQTRSVITESQHGGSECPTELSQSQECFIQDCDLVASPNFGCTGSNLDASAIGDFGTPVDGSPECVVASTAVCARKCTDSEACEGFEAHDGQCCFRSKITQKTQKTTNHICYKKMDGSVGPAETSPASPSTQQALQNDTLLLIAGAAIVILLSKVVLGGQSEHSKSKGESLSITPEKKEPQSDTPTPGLVR